MTIVDGQFNKSGEEQHSEIWDLKTTIDFDLAHIIFEEFFGRKVSQEEITELVELGKASYKELNTSVSRVEKVKFQQKICEMLGIAAASDRQLDVWTQQIQQHLDVIINEYPPRFNSYGLFAPSYMEEMRKYRSERAPEACTILLLGALTPDSEMEFRDIVQGIFPDATAVVLDLYAESAWGDPFVQGDALALPIADNSIDMIHTNALLHALENGTNKSNIELLLKEIYRVLKPGGKAVMIESHLNKVFPQERMLKVSFNDALRTVGFTNVDDASSTEFKHRRYLYNLTNQVPGAHNVKTVKSAQAPLFTAQKPLETSLSTTHTSPLSQ